jgi:hypothetical protein
VDAVLGVHRRDLHLLQLEWVFRFRGRLRGLQAVVLQRVPQVARDRLNLWPRRPLCRCRLIVRRDKLEVRPQEPAVLICCVDLVSARRGKLL